MVFRVEIHNYHSLADFEVDVASKFVVISDRGLTISLPSATVT